MAIARHEPRTTDVFERFFRPWRMRPLALWPMDPDDVLHVEEYQDDGTLVIRAEMAGIDPEKDVDVTVAHGVLHIGAQRRQEEETDGKDFYRRELRYGSFSRDLPLPDGTSPSDIQATYKDGILEVRVRVPEGTSAPDQTVKVPVAKA